jgi:hypothetical protein
VDGYLQAAESFSGGGSEVAIGLHGVVAMLAWSFGGSRAGFAR